MKFADLNIRPPQSQHFIGDKIKVARVINCEIEVIQFKIDDSKQNDKKCLTMQIKHCGELRVIFTGAQYLIKQIEQVTQEMLPFMTTIIQQEDKGYLFT